MSNVNCKEILLIGVALGSKKQLVFWQVKGVEEWRAKSGEKQVVLEEPSLR